jgi:hypothetical protein
MRDYLPRISNEEAMMREKIQKTIKGEGKFIAKMLCIGVIVLAFDQVFEFPWDIFLFLALIIYINLVAREEAERIIERMEEK